MRNIGSKKNPVTQYQITKALLPYLCHIWVLPLFVHRLIIIYPSCSAGVLLSIVTKRSIESPVNRKLFCRTCATPRLFFFGCIGFDFHIRLFEALPFLCISLNFYTRLAPQGYFCRLSQNKALKVRSNESSFAVFPP